MSKVKNVKRKVIEDSEEDSESELPLITSKPAKKQQVQEKKVAKKVVKPSSDEEDTPVVKPKPSKQIKTETAPVKKAAQEKKKIVQPSSDEQQSQEEKPKKIVAKAKSPLQKAVVAKKVVKQSSEQESQEEKPAKKVAVKAKSPVQPALKQTKKAAKVQSEDEESEQEAKPVKKAAKSPAQKPVAQKAKVVEPESEEEQKPKRKQSKDSIKPKTKSVEADEEGQFQICIQALSYEAYDSDIQDLLKDCGNITSVRLLTRPDGKSKGTAFVKFSKKSSFLKALEFNGAEHFGRNLKIEEAQKRDNVASFGAPRANGFNKGGPVESNANIETPTLFIGGLSYNSTAESLTSFFSQAGSVASARIVTDKQTGKPRGFGYIQFYDVETAKKAYKEYNGASVDGRNIRLDSATQRDRPQGGSFGGNRGSFGGSQGGFGGQSRNPGNSTVDLSQDDKNAKKGAIGTFQGKRMAL